MTARRLVNWLVYTTVLIVEVLVVCAGVRAEVPRDPPAMGDSLQAVFDRIHEHAKDDAWRKEGWKDELTETWLDQFVAAVAKEVAR